MCPKSRCVSQNVLHFKIIHDRILPDFIFNFTIKCNHHLRNVEIRHSTVPYSIAVNNVDVQRFVQSIDVQRSWRKDKVKREQIWQQKRKK